MKTRPKAGQTCYFAVRGSSDFPFDMLRYDACWPSSSADALEIAQTAYSEPKGLRTVVLACKPGGVPVPTRARWHSFGWMTTQLFDNSVDASKGKPL